MDNIRQNLKLWVNAESVSYKNVILNIFNDLYFDGNMFLNNSDEYLQFFSYCPPYLMSNRLLANFQSSFSHCRLCFLATNPYFCGHLCIFAGTFVRRTKG